MYFTGLFLAFAASLCCVSASSPFLSSTPCSGYVICVDGISDCGVSFGGCYDACSEPAPTPEPCPATGTTTTPTPTPQTPSTSTDDCSTRTVCIDAINECGMRYGGCVPDCRPFDLTTPPCPATTMATATILSAN